MPDQTRFSSNNSGSSKSSLSARILRKLDDSLLANASLKFVSLIIAVVLWFVVLESRNVEVTKEVPIEIMTPSDLVVANDVADRVAFKLSGPKAFLRNISARKESAIKVNLESQKAGLVTYRFFSDNIQVPIGVKVLSVNPTAIVVKLEPVKGKEIPIRLVTKGEVAPGFRLEHLELIKHTLKVRGPETRIEGISEATTVPLDLGRLRDSGERDLPADFSKTEGIGIEGDLPRVRFSVVQETANFKIKGVAVKVLADKRFKIAPTEVNLYVRCSPDDLKLLEHAIAAVVADLRGKGAGSYDVALTPQLPTAVKLLKILPARAKVLLY